MAAMQAELKRLRKENKQLKMEREILKKAAAFFAREQEEGISIIDTVKKAYAISILCKIMQVSRSGYQCLENGTMPSHPFSWSDFSRRSW